MKDHEEDDKVHLHLSIEKIHELSIGLEKLKGKKTIFVNLHNFAEKKKKKVLCTSESFFTVPSRYKMNIVVFCNGGGNGVGTYMLVGTQLFDVPYKKQLTKWPFKGTVTVELLNQLQDAGYERVNIVFTDNKSAEKLEVVVGVVHSLFLIQSCPTMQLPILVTLSMTLSTLKLLWKKITADLCYNNFSHYVLTEEAKGAIYYNF